jgi:Mrp family chromosome partitioning ATPase
MFTSIAENEGKTSIASNVALSLAAKGKKVLLVDFDFMKPAIYKFFELGFEVNSELGELFNNQIAMEKFRFRKFKDTNLSIALNTKQYKESVKWIENGDLEKFIRSVEDKVDFIIIDTAPFAVDSSVSAIAKFAHKLVFVNRADVVRADDINKTISILENAGAKIAGCILNDVYTDYTPFGFLENTRLGRYYYSKYGHYSKYGKYGYYGNNDNDFRGKFYGNN